jgi:signal transduction histidine kinase
MDLSIVQQAKAVYKTRMNFQRLRILLITAFMAVSLVPSAFLGFKIISQGKAFVKERASTYLEGLAERNAEAVKGFMEERINDVNRLSNIICSLDFDYARLNAHLEQTRAQYEPYLGFYILDESGAAVFTTSKIPFDFKQLHSSPEKTGAGKDTNQVFMLVRDQEEIPVAAICSPMADGFQKPCGSLCALVDFRLVSALLKKSNIEITGEVYLVDETGIFLSDSRFGAKALKDKISVLFMEGGTKGIYETEDYRGERVLQVYRKIDGFSWYVTADQDMAEILSRIRELGHEAMLYGLLTALFVFGLALFASTLLVNFLKAKYRYEKELEFQVIQKEKLASLGLLTSGLAHELNTPLANALMYTQIAREELDETGPDLRTIQERLSTVADEVRQGSRIVRNLLDFSRHTQGDLQRTDANRILTKLMDISGPHCTSRQIKVELALEKGMPDICVDPSTLQAILTNLVANAVEAMPHGGILKITTRYVPVLKIVKIEIADTGPGMDKEELTKIFTPFYTTKKPGEGTGLGLFVSHEMARKLGGDIKVMSSTRESGRKSGTVFTIEFPTDEASRHK